MTEKEIKELAITARKQMEEAIIALLSIQDGLTNSEIAEKLNLHSSHEGGQKDYLTYSILGILMSKGSVEKIRYYNSRNPIYKLKKPTKTAVEESGLEASKIRHDGCKKIISFVYKGKI